jgi:hypothetical protein
MRNLPKLLVFFCVSVWFNIGTAWAHKGSDAYLEVQEVAKGLATSEPLDRALQGYRFTLAVAIKDLDLVLPMDANADGKVTWGEAKTTMPLVLTLLNASANTEQNAGPLAKDAAAASASAVAACRLDWTFSGIENRSDGAYLRFVAQSRCIAAQALAFRYTLFKEQDASHRLLVAGHLAGKDLLTTARPQQTSSLVLMSGKAESPDAAPLASTQASSSRWAALRDYAAMGMRHLLEGYDHLAFLLALVLPLRLRLARAAGAGAWLALLRTVTAFTIGHSITLVLATLGLTQASPKWVEPVIAVSIAVTAFLNLRPLAWLRTDVLALGFGLVHGFGFAGLLLEAAAPGGLLPWALAGFNLGIEVGQLFAVSLWVLASQVLVGKAWYARVVVRGGSIVLILLSAWWFWQRVS